MGAKCKMRPVVMFLDRAKIVVKAGNGGDGKVSFYRDKFTTNGGPDGGDGGRGGDIILVASRDVNTLVDFKFQKHFRAGNGESGGSKHCTGADGKDIVIKVPCGCVVKEVESEKVIVDMFEEGQTYTLLRGGNGGKGNQNFSNPRRQAPNFAQKGALTEEREVVLELKTIADVGLVGFPNVGKSTLLSAISDAKPKIANYHFTTLAPNLGVVKYYDKTCVVADIPGLIEGASEGAGLGHEFLRHIERTRMLVHVVDIAGSEGRDPYDDFVKINAELKTYSEKLAERPQIVAMNKCDMLGDNKEVIENFTKKVEFPCIEVSAFTHKGIDELLQEVFKKLATLPQIEPERTEAFDFDVAKDLSFEIRREDDGSFVVEGSLIDNIVRGVNLFDYESFAYFNKRIKEDGIEDALYAKGAKIGDTIHLGGVEFTLE